MNGNEKNLPTRINDPQKAVELVRKYKSENQLVYVSEEDLRTQSMFLPEVVVIHSTPEDFHKISGKFMPQRHQMDRISEAAGIKFVEDSCGTRTEQVDGNTVYVGFAQGTKRMPDGSWRTSSICEYEFDPVKRAEEDVLRDTQGRYKTDKDKTLLRLNYQKFARQRANSGARLRVIRELTGMPTSLEGNQLKKAMVFYRIAINTDRLLEDPALRGEAVKAALGASQQIYGETNYQVENGDAPPQIEGPREKEPPAGGEPRETTAAEPWDLPDEGEEDPLTMALGELRAFYEKYEKVLPDGPKGIIGDELRRDEHNLETVSSLVDRASDWEQRYLEKKGVRS